VILNLDRMEPITLSWAILKMVSCRSGSYEDSSSWLSGLTYSDQPKSTLSRSPALLSKSNFDSAHRKKGFLRSPDVVAPFSFSRRPLGQAISCLGIIGELHLVSTLNCIGF
jgi:hypothetical protein